MAGLTGRRTLVWLALLLLAVSCARTAPGIPGSGSPPASAWASPSGDVFPVTLTDDDGVSVTIPRQPRRIVTFAPSNTEIVFALGLGDRVVGVSGSYDDYPPEARSITRVGGAGEFGVDPNAETVVSLQPDLFLAIAGGETWKQRLRDLGIPVFTINASDFPDLLHDIGVVGRITGASGAAGRLTAAMEGRANDIAAAVAAEPPVSCFFEVYYPPLTTVGPHTFIFDLLERAGCRPVSEGAKADYPEWSVDALVASGPAVYLVASESGVSPAQVGKRPGFRAIQAVAEGHVYLVDSDLISRPGPRVVAGLQQLAQILHPAAFPAA